MAATTSSTSAASIGSRSTATATRSPTRRACPGPSLASPRWVRTTRRRRSSRAMEDASLAELGERLSSVGGVVAVVLGGSRARGTHRPDSDIDLGLYYRGGLDVAALQELAGQETDEPVGVTAPGGWGPWAQWSHKRLLSNADAATLLETQR